MLLEDLENAKKSLREKNLTLSIAKDGRIIFETASHGISGFLEAIEKFGEKLCGASVADKICGRAIALLCVYAKVRAVYAMILSRRAKEVLETYNVYHEWEKLVETILDMHKRGVCPFEKLASKISSPKDSYEKLLGLYKNLKHKTQL
ncbi:MAG: DUF1893 domain-containing protein [Candidatus Bathyarchaeia archaeon]